MIYKIAKGTKPSIPSYGRYAAKAIHTQTITQEMLMKEIERNCSAKASDVMLVLTELQDVMLSHLRDGCKIELPAIGTMKLEIRSKTVDSPEAFCAEKHVKGFCLHIVPKCRNGKPEIYKGIRLAMAEE